VLYTHAPALFAIPGEMLAERKALLSNNSQSFADDRLSAGAGPLD
jgi:hypothetical protein